MKERHRYGQCYIAREKAEYERSLKTKSITSASMGIRIRRRGNAVTASSSDRGIGQPVRQYAYRELTYAAFGKAEEGKGKQKKTVQPSVLVLIGETDRRKAKSCRGSPPVSYGRAKTFVERERKKGTRKRYEYFRRSPGVGENGRKRMQGRNTKTLRAFPPVSKRERKQSKESARKGQENATGISTGLKARTKMIERERKKHAIQRQEGKGVSLAVCPTVPELRSPHAWKRESTGEFVKRQNRTPTK